MDSRSIAFLEVMIGLGVAGLLAFLILLVARAAMRPMGDDTAAKASPAWWGFLLAFLLTLIIAVLLAIHFAPFGEEQVAEVPAEETEAPAEGAETPAEGTEAPAEGEAAPPPETAEAAPEAEGAPPDAAAGEEGAATPPAEPADAETPAATEDAAAPEAPAETAAEEGAAAEADAPPADAEAPDAAEEVAAEPAGPPDWRLEGRGQAFYIVMLIIGGLALLGFLIVLFARILPAHAALAANEAAPKPAAAEAETPAMVETPSAARLIGLLLFAIMYLLLNWIYLERGDQHALLVTLVYPASLGVALVLLFDKATRAWSAKSGSETVREWLMCAGFTFLLLLGFLNLRDAAADETYAAMFWDFLAIVLFFLAFWLVDRKATRYRFLGGYGYLILLPILLIIWRATQGVVMPEGLSWWDTVWPAFLLAIIFFVLEIILLIASRDAARHGIAAVKDVLFVVLYAITLIIAIPPEVAA